MRYLPHLLLLFSTALAFQLPFKVPFFKVKELLEDDPVDVVPRIAIIGAGAGGSSAAFWISQAKKRFGLDVEIDVYEKSDYVGGRSTTVYPHGDITYRPIELGASIFVKANKNLWRATEEFNLSRRHFEAEDNAMGVWDGQNLLLSLSGGWWDTAKVIWRYGILSPKRTDAMVKSLIQKFLTFYSPETPRWDNISSVASALGWTDAIIHTTAEYLTSHGISHQYAYELVEAATRVNYGQDADKIHALEGMVSLAATGASAVEDGNYKIFVQFLARSGATVYLNSTVTSITPKSATSHYWTVRSSQGAKHYKAVILAAPFHQTDITVPLSISDQIPKQPYVHLHVTLLTTTSPHFNSAYFGLPAEKKAPGMMLTTNEAARQGWKAPEFNSISYLGKVREGEWAVKVFSKEPVSDEWLAKMFEGKVGWVYRKVWDAYPQLPPTATFPPVKLDTGLYYVNAFEPFISTMETETIASRNVVDLLLNEEFGSSICGPRISATESGRSKATVDDGFVFGWDC